MDSSWRPPVARINQEPEEVIESKPVKRITAGQLDPDVVLPSTIVSDERAPLTASKLLAHIPITAELLLDHEQLRQAICKAFKATYISGNAYTVQGHGERVEILPDGSIRFYKRPTEL